VPVTGDPVLLKLLHPHMPFLPCGNRHHENYGKLWARLFTLWNYLSKSGSHKNHRYCHFKHR